MFEMDIKTSGFDKSQNHLENLGQSMVYDGMKKHCDDIMNEANEICGLTTENFQLIVKKGEGDKLIISGNLKNKDKCTCVKEAFDKILPTLPNGIRQIFENFFKKIEEDCK